ncbi:hypothetical protein [Paenibacillus mucilaginosus]|uniref:Uncharacterized protein n=2 Tax=Paenibacillus mucilaginosus TaxID=61624 RepID=F8FBU2_PAEMK|nr:hypothetical protein [Paenibacillus mucilaginosus]AEI43703.1 hypothetical protein KNP414_05179 [Paenibacillus mucilaginosus KNP414]MCG7216937.1 hypothetical protein [Paenibacillus mucilaginosus]WDM25220.1 hypothetical protein KCX80_22460 [Paenibacillus mucilaginosus]
MGKRMMKGAAWLLASTAAMLLVTAWLDWYMTLSAGALLTLVRRSRPSGLLAFVSGGIGWIGPVLFLAAPAELFVFTERIGGAFGLSGMAASAAVLLLPFLLGGVLAAGGSWQVRLAAGLWAQRQQGFHRPLQPAAAPEGKLQLKGTE